MKQLKDYQIEYPKTDRMWTEFARQIYGETPLYLEELIPLVFSLEMLKQTLKIINFPKSSIFQNHQFSKIIKKQKCN